MMQIRIVIIDPRQLIRGGFAKLLRRPLFNVVAAGRTLGEAFGGSTGMAPADVVVLGHSTKTLYKGPRILFLDEGTAHLDVENEMQINEKLRRLDITRISVAHRPEMMTGADTVLRIG